MRLTMVRQAKVSDFASIYEMIDFNANDFEKKDKAKKIFHDNLENENSIFLVSAVKDEVIGFVSCFIHKSLSYIGDIAEIQEVNVLNQKDEQKVYKKLIVALQNFLKDRGVKLLQICKNPEDDYFDLLKDLDYKNGLCKLSKVIK